MYCWLRISAVFFFFKQKTAYELRISDWSSDVCSSDLLELVADRMFRVLVGEAERTIETGEVDKTPEQSGEPWHRGLARSVVAAFLFGTLRQLLGRRAQHLEIAGRRIGRALLRSHFAQPVGGLIEIGRAHV